jgi:hypothetical protein
MDYTVQRMTSDADGFSTYTLFDANGTSLLQADQSQSPPPDARRQIRLARPGGKLVATIDIPQVVAVTGDEGHRADYAIIHDFAVYAIVSVRRRPAAEGNGERSLYYMLEVEGETWLALPHPEQDACYALYDEVPAGLQTYDTLTELDLPTDIGQICRHGDGETLAISLESSRLAHTDLIVLALALLVDQSGTVR